MIYEKEMYHFLILHFPIALFLTAYVLDIVGLVNIILNPRTADLLDNATNATLITGDSFIKLESDGLVQGIEIELIHGKDFSITLEK